MLGVGDGWAFAALGEFRQLRFQMIGQLQQEKDFDGSKSYISRPSIGIGLQLFSLRIDYAFTDVGDSQNRYSHVISLQLDLKPKKKSTAP